jgi:hypothetical protein
MFTNTVQVFRNVEDAKHTVSVALGASLNQLSLFASHLVILATYFCFPLPTLLNQNSNMPLLFVCFVAVLNEPSSRWDLISSHLHVGLLF